VSNDDAVKLTVRRLQFVQRLHDRILDMQRSSGVKQQNGALSLFRKNFSVSLQCVSSASSWYGVLFATTFCELDVSREML